MKYAIVIPDGAADEPVEQLDGRTPLEAAKTSNIDWIASEGRQGCVVTVPQGLEPGSDVATMSVLGYDPRTDYSGRAPLEAAARGIAIRGGQLIFRCNFVTIVDGRMADFTAGHIRQREADQLIADLNRHLSDEGCQFHAGVSYRNLMTAPKAVDANMETTQPHDIPDQPVADHLPRGPGSNWVRRVMERAHLLLRDHDVTLVREDLGENPATNIWLWGQGRPRPLEPFASRFGISGVIVAAVDLIRGIGRSIGLELIDVPGATGYLDTNYAGKGAAAVAALESFDLVIVHIEAPDEAGHLGDADAKVSAIERIDEHVVGPLLEKLRTFGQWKIMVVADHPTPVGRRIHTSTPPPFCIAGHMIQSVMKRSWSESSAAASDLQVDPGHHLMEYFLWP